MSVSLLIITHNEIGDALLSAAHSALGELPLPTTVVAVTYEMDPDDILKKLKKLIKAIKSSDGILILTDLYGSTPCNIAKGLKEFEHVNVISGLNLPMLIRLMNYPKLGLKDLTKKALSGGRDGIMIDGEINS